MIAQLTFFSRRSVFTTFMCSSSQKKIFSQLVRTQNQNYFHIHTPPTKIYYYIRRYSNFYHAAVCGRTIEIIKEKYLKFQQKKSNRMKMLI